MRDPSDFIPIAALSTFGLAAGSGLALNPDAWGILTYPLLLIAVGGLGGIVYSAASAVITAISKRRFFSNQFASGHNEASARAAWEAATRPPKPPAPARAPAAPIDDSLSVDGYSFSQIVLIHVVTIAVVLTVAVAIMDYGPSVGARVFGASVFVCSCIVWIFAFGRILIEAPFHIARVNENNRRRARINLLLEQAPYGAVRSDLDNDNLVEELPQLFENSPDRGFIAR